jgi:hypothetical protein
VGFALIKYLPLLVVAMLLAILYRLLWRSTPRQGGAGERSLPEEMKRDPHCGTYVAEHLAVREKTPQGILYFCSTVCRDEFFKKTD